MNQTMNEEQVMEGEREDKCNTENSYFSELMSSMVTDVENKAFDNFFGAEQSVDMLKSYVVLPLKFPQLYIGGRAPLFNSFMLFGAPGCGKSHLVYATAKGSGVKLFVFHVWNLQSVLYGGKERAKQCIETVFEVIKSNSPCILCLEDLEVLSREETHFKNGRAALLTQLRSHPRMEGVVIIGTTMTPWKVDSELRRQFRPSHVCLPDQKERVQILHSLLDCSTHYMKKSDFEEIADGTQGFTGADMHCLIHSARMKPIKLLMEATHFKKVKVQEAEAEPHSDAISTISNEATVSPSQPEETDQSANQKFAESIHCSKQQVEARKTGEKFIACEPEDEGAIPMTCYDIPEDKLYIEHDVTMDFMRQALQDSHATISEEEISRLKQFESEFCSPVPI